LLQVVLLRSVRLPLLMPPKPPLALALVVMLLPLHTKPALLIWAALMNAPLLLSKPALLLAVALRHVPLPKPL
jgi:hypothetical protein